MPGAVRKSRLAVVSPFVDKRHGTERRVTEWIAQLAATYEIHIYSQDVQDLDLTKVTWHRIPKLPGPHLLNYLWWFAANRLWRAWDSRFRNLRPDLVYSPGINCLDADVMSVHIVFAQYVQGIQAGLKLSRNSILAWPRVIHRRLYYRLVRALERRLYSPPGVPLVLIAKHTAAALENIMAVANIFPSSMSASITKFSIPRGAPRCAKMPAMSWASRQTVSPSCSSGTTPATRACP